MPYLAHVHVYSQVFRRRVPCFEGELGLAATGFVSRTAFPRTYSTSVVSRTAFPELTPFSLRAKGLVARVQIASTSTFRLCTHRQFAAPMHVWAV